MSEPKRYDAGMLEKARPDGTGTMYVYAISEKSDGPFVSYEDYANLKAKVERLRKAGDNLSRAIRENGCHDNGDFEDQQNAIQAWNAAKEARSDA